MPAPMKSTLATPVPEESDNKSETRDLANVRQGLEDTIRMSELIRSQQSNIINTMINQGPSTTSGSTISIENFKNLPVMPITPTNKAAVLSESTVPFFQKASGSESEIQNSQENEPPKQIQNTANVANSSKPTFPPTLPPPPPPLCLVRPSKVLGEAGRTDLPPTSSKNGASNGRIKRRYTPATLRASEVSAPRKLKRVYIPPPLQIPGKGPYYPPIIPPVPTHGLNGFVSRFPVGMPRSYEGIVNPSTLNSTVHKSITEASAHRTANEDAVSSKGSSNLGAIIVTKSTEASNEGPSCQVRLENDTSEEQKKPPKSEVNKEKIGIHVKDELKSVIEVAKESNASSEDKDNSNLNTKGTIDTQRLNSKSPKALKVPEAESQVTEDKSRAGRLRVPPKRFINSTSYPPKAKNTKDKLSQTESSLFDSESNNNGSGSNKSSRQASTTSTESTYKPSRKQPVSDVFLNDLVKAAPFISQPPSAQMCCDGNGTCPSSDSVLDISFDIPLSKPPKKASKKSKKMDKVSIKGTLEGNGKYLTNNPLTMPPNRPFLNQENNYIRRNPEIPKETDAILGTILFRGSDAFNFTIFKGSDKKAKENFLNICQTAWDKYLSLRRSTVKPENSNQSNCLPPR